MPQLFANAARAKLTAAISSSATSISIDAGALFPVATAGTSAVGDGNDWFKAVLQSETAFEIVYVRTHTSGSATLSNVLRAQEGTTAAAFAIDDIIGIRPLASDAYAAGYQRTPRSSHTGSAIIPGGTAAQRDASPAAGYFRYNSDLDLFEGYIGGQWRTIGAASVIQAVVEFTATAGQTTFTTAYTAGQIGVFRNGALLPPSDYAASNGTTVVLGTAAALGDNVTVVKYLTASLANAVAKSGDTMSGSLNFSGASLRITGDFSNAAPQSRLLFQTNVANGGSVVGVIPNGSATSAHMRLYGDSDTTNASYLGLRSAGSTDVRLESAYEGAGSYVPMTFYTGGAERMRIDVAGNVGVGATNPLSKFVVQNLSLTGGGPATSGGAADPNSVTRLQGGSVALDFGVYQSGAYWLQARIAADYTSNQWLYLNPNGGAVLVGGGGFGYGTGAGGTVTQATSKSNTVTLNKACGTITMHSESIAAGASVWFFLSNSLVNVTDTVIANITNEAVSSPSSYELDVTVGAAAVYFSIRNRTAGALAEAIKINFTLHKGARS